MIMCYKTHSHVDDLQVDTVYMVWMTFKKKEDNYLIINQMREDVAKKIFFMTEKHIHM